MQDTKNNNTEHKDLAVKLAEVTVTERKMWIEGIKANMVQGDMKRIQQLTGYKYYQIRQVFQGHTYNPKFAPEIIERTLDIIKARKEKMEEVKTEVSKFFS
jgi:hypothetical protein